MNLRQVVNSSCSSMNFVTSEKKSLFISNKNKSNGLDISRLISFSSMMNNEKAGDRRIISQMIFYSNINHVYQEMEIFAFSNLNKTRTSQLAFEEKCTENPIFPSGKKRKFRLISCRWISKNCFSNKRKIVKSRRMEHRFLCSSKIDCTSTDHFSLFDGTRVFFLTHSASHQENTDQINST